MVYDNNNHHVTVIIIVLCDCDKFIFTTYSLMPCNITKPKKTFVEVETKPEIKPYLKQNEALSTIT